MERRIPRSRGLTPEQELAEIEDLFMLESANYKLGNETQRADLMPYINAILDAYLDMWPKLIPNEVDPITLR